ncbi:hypothetical protein D9615_005855 [Tricholomella constricta]|uniref:DUF6593 domain-containing protein n=1 Tax=Tricholomella constricta TaxID=117010 RepID=A0A8H5M346_9AGAR|nr:hypothetical protein D9615_005855 [Tricholomella constricta]
MQLYLSGPRAFHSTYHDANGQAIYKVRTSSQVFGRTTTVSRILRNEILYDHSMRDIFGHLAQIEWKSFRSSILRFYGREMRTRSFFKKQGWGWHGCDRVFAAPDGREYRWKLGTAAPEAGILDLTLYLMANPYLSQLRSHNEKQTLVARFNPGGNSCFFSARSPFLEILPAGEHIADAIVVSFVYIEKLREDE